jgi:lysophospholipase L1-like esterase
MIRSVGRAPGPGVTNMSRLIILVVLLFVASCAKNNPSEPTPGGGGEAQIHYTAIGASDAIGVGASLVCVPFVECPDGTGYVPVVGRRFQAAGRPVTIVNLGIPGAVLGPELETLGNELGRSISGNFLEREAPFVPRDSTLITVFAGGNDANTIAAALLAGRAGGDLEGYAQARISTFGNDLRALVDMARGRAPEARVIVLNLPNLAGLPYASGRSVTERQWLQRIAVGLSAEINALAGSNVTVLDLMCDSLFYDSVMYASDGFHPNNFGHARIADLIFQAANSAASSTPTPRTSCSAMTLF